MPGAPTSGRCPWDAGSSSARRGRRRGRSRATAWSCSSSPGVHSGPVVTARPGAASSSSSGRSMPPASAHVLDAGCGSGILAIAAARLGVARVDAIDVDPDAVAATADNARRNGVTERVRGTLASIDTWPGPAAPLVLANLLAAAHVTLAPTLARLVSPGGEPDRGRAAHPRGPGGGRRFRGRRLLAGRDRGARGMGESPVASRRMKGRRRSGGEPSPGAGSEAGPRPRVFVRPEAVLGDRVRFEPDEARHLGRVRRLRPGDLVDATDGAGHLYTVRVTALDGRAPGAPSRAGPSRAASPRARSPSRRPSSRGTGWPGSSRKPPSSGWRGSSRWRPRAWSRAPPPERCHTGGGSGSPGKR